MEFDCLFQYRISKYSRQSTPDMAVDDQWTSIFDIGKTFGGKVLTYSEYINTENQYLELIKWVCKSSGVERLQITNLEDYQCLSPCENLSWTESVEQIVNIARDCLRERYWCRLHAHNFFIHFGYDYYLYMGTQLDYLQMHCIANSLGVFVEKMSSPYCVLSSE